MTSFIIHLEWFKYFITLANPLGVLAFCILLLHYYKFDLRLAFIREQFFASLKNQRTIKCLHLFTITLLVVKSIFSDGASTGPRGPAAADPNRAGQATPTSTRPRPPPTPSSRQPHRLHQQSRSGFAPQ